MIFPTEKEARDFLATMPNPGVIAIPTTHNHWAITGAETAAQPPKTCAICGQPFREYPNNPQPVAEGECCAWCDDHEVTPARILQSRLH
jgi:hypothetical protein